jgi:EAL domain-containing protein (putative c-di-GMP-specific phosphodiesterase class I)/CheY-like chemotaxis protein
MTMPDSSPPLGGSVFYLGADLAFFAVLRERLARHAIHAHAVRTVAGLMLAVGERPAGVLLLDPGILPPGRSVESILERLEGATGRRPSLICMIAQVPPGERAPSPCAEALTTYQAPFKVDDVAAFLVALAAGRRPRRPRVVLVDAAPAEAHALRETLLRGGLEVEQVTDPRAVIPAIERAPTDLVLLDLNLPEGAGRTLTVAIRDHAVLYDLPIVFLSAEPNRRRQGEVLHLGEDDYLARPLERDHVLSVVLARLERTRTGAAACSPRLSGDGTGEVPLLTRTQLIKRLDHALLDQHAAATGQGVLFIRIDGEVAADAAERLQALRPLLFAMIHRNAGAAHRGGCLAETGLCLWVRCGSDADLLVLADRLRAEARTLAPGPGGVPVTLSIGIGRFSPLVDNALTLISHAESACTQAQRAGGDRVILHQARVGGPEGGDDTLLLNLLRRALTGSGFQLVYQPILSLRRAQHEFYEVLLRLRTPVGDIIPPLTFLPVAARHGLLPDLDRWVLSGALDTLRIERDTGRPSRLLIHQSAASLAEPDWLGWLRDAILRRDLIRQRPLLEFNVRDLLADEEHARLLFPELGRLGIEICLAGVTDAPEVLGLIARRPIGLVKLAREMVGHEALPRLRSLILALHERGARAIAAGIEDPESIGRIWSSGADYLQGNFIQFPEDTLNFDFHGGVVR